MAKTTGVVLATGGIAVANEVLFAPLAGQKIQFNWRIIPATGLFAFGLAALEKVAAGFALALAWLSLATVFIVRLGNAPTPLENVNKALHL